MGNPIKDWMPDIFKTDWLVNKFPLVFFETLLDETQEVVETECIAELYWIGPFFTISEQPAE